MNKTKIASICLIVFCVALAVVSFFVLPDTVTTQLGTGGNVSTMPKPLAIVLPTLLGVGGAVYALLSKEENAGKGKGLLISAVGVIVFAIMLVVNL